MRRAFTLPETIIATFVLAAGMLVVVQLLHTGLRYSARVQKRLLGAVLAQKRLAELRGWARDASSFASGSGYNGSPSDPDYPGYQIEVQVASTTLFSPCTSLETSYPAAQQRSMQQSFLKAKVTVRWPPYGGSDQLSVLSLLGEPARPLASVSITGAGGGGIPDPVPVGGPPAPGAGLEAVGTDTSGNTIPDMFFHWYVNSGTGNGGLVPQRPSSNATFYNAVMRYNGTPTSTGGSCQVTARGRSGGVEKWSAPVTLNL